jgi:hypothetical protein
MPGSLTENDPLSPEDAQWIRKADERLYQNCGSNFYDNSPVISDQVIQKLRAIPEIDKRLGPRREVRAYALYKEVFRTGLVYSTRKGGSFLAGLVERGRIDDIFHIIEALKNVPEEDKLIHHQFLGEVLRMIGRDIVPLINLLTKADSKNFHRLMELLEGAEAISERALTGGGTVEEAEDGKVTWVLGKRFDKDGEEVILFDQYDFTKRTILDVVLSYHSGSKNVLCDLADTKPKAQAIEEITDILNKLASNPGEQDIAKSLRHWG